MSHEFAPIRGGIATYVEGTARAAAAEGFPCEVWTFGYTHPRDNDYPFKVIRLGTKPTQNWTDRLRLASKIRAYRDHWGDVVLCLPEPGPLRMWLYKNVLGLPTPRAVIPIFHGSELGLIKRWPHRRKLLLTFLESTSKIGVVSNYVKTLMPENERLRSKVVRVPGAPLTVPSEPIRRSKSLDDRPFHLLSIGRIQKRKGQLQIMEALGKLPLSQRNGFKLTLVGRSKDTSYLRQIREQAKRLMIDLSVVGECSETKRKQLLTAADLFLFPSCADGYRVEGLGLAVLEAATYGLPALGSLHGGVPEAIVDGETGWLVDTNDAQAFADKLMEIKNDQEAHRKCSDAGMVWVREQFDYQANVRRLFGEYF